VNLELASALATDSTTMLVVETDPLASAPAWTLWPDLSVAEIARLVAVPAAREPHEPERSRRWPLLFFRAVPEPPGRR
jgi:TPP-dependent trihydroxycyclohexane-1,2-dione (THcHDO) dehydratase